MRWFIARRKVWSIGAQTNNRKIEAFTIHSNLAEGGQKTFQVFLNQGFVIDHLKILIERETWMNPIDWI